MLSFLRFKNAGLSRKSMFVKLLVSNGLLLLLPVILWFILYINIEQVMRKNAESSNQAMLEQLQLHMDSKFNEVHQLSRQIILNPKLDVLLEKGNEDLSQHFLFVQFARDYLKAYPSVVNNSFIHDFYIFLERSNTIIKPGLVTDAYSFYHNYYQFDHQSYQDWRESLLHYQNQVYLPASSLRHSHHPNAASMNVITFSQSLPVNNLVNIGGNLQVLINESQVHEITRQIQLANQSSIYLMSENQQILSSSPGAPPLPLSIINELNANAGFFNYPLNDQQFMVSYSTSDIAGLYYISAMPLEIYFKKMKDMQHFALILLFIFILVGIIVAYINAYKNFSPIKRIVEAISDGTSRPQKPATNELDYIMDMLKVSWDEEKDVKNKLAQQLPLLRSNYLHRLMQSYFEPPEQMKQSLEFMNIRFPHSNFAVILVDIDNLSRFTTEQSEKQWALARFIITNLVEDLSSDTHTIYSVELEKDRLAFIINVAADPLNHRASKVESFFPTVHDVLEKRFKLETSFAVSGIHKGQQQVGEAYLEAAAALEYKLVNGQKSILYFQSIRHEKLQYHYPVETELQFMNCIRSGDSEQVIQLLTDLFDMNFGSEAIAPELGRCLFFSLSGTLLRILNSDTRVLRRFAEGEINPVRLLLSCKTTDEMFVKTKALYVMVTESFKLERRDHNEQLLELIQTYIDTNYSDSNMSLNLLSEHLQITPQYISQFFKKMSGLNFSDYLTNTRITHAKKIMAESNLNNGQIAQKVGYTSDTVFIRVFKKAEGLTPGKYKEMISKHADELEC